MRSVHLLPISLLITSYVSAADPIAKLVQHVFPSFGSKSAESTKTILADLGIGDHAFDTTKIVNITDLNWEQYLGPQSTGQWLVEFTADQEHCASCEYIDLAFNVSYCLVRLMPGCIT
jgi:hypothetical protein